MKTRSSRGIVFVSLLAIVTLVAMLTAAFLTRSQSTLFGAASYRDGLRAEQAARAGANHLFHLLDKDRTHNTPLEGELDGATYSATFNSTSPYYSVNNLDSSTPAGQRSWQGHEVSGHSADLLVVGVCGRSRRVLRVVVQEGISSVRSVAALGRVVLSGDVEVDGVKSLVPQKGERKPDPAPGGILSKHRTQGPLDPAIEWKSEGRFDFQLSELSRLETAPAQSNVSTVSADLHSQFADKTIDQGAADSIPEIDVAAHVQAGMSSPPLSGGSVQSGYVVVKDERSFSGDLTINGDLVLNQGTLFVRGSLTINGGVEGLGGLIVDGDLHIRGGNTVVQTSLPTGAAILASGDVRLEGLDLSTYLGAISESDPTFSGAVENLERGLLKYEQDPTTSLWGQSATLSKTTGGPGAVSWISPFPGPDGSFNYADSSGLIPAVAKHCKAYALTHPGDEKAQKLVSAMEELQFFFRHNLHNVRVDHEGQMYGLTRTGTSPPSFSHPPIPLVRLPDYQLGTASDGLPIPGGLTDFNYPPNGYLGGGASPNLEWDDRSLPLESYTHDHLGYGENLDTHDARRKAFLLYNPADLSWLGQSSLQGIVYARGNIHADTKFRLIGSMVALGDVTLTNGSTLVFNEEYRSLLGAQLPLGFVHLEEL